MKIKIGVPGDRENMQAVRDVAPAKTVRVDANEGWKTKEQALEMIQWLAQDKHIEYVEQPINTEDYATVLLHYDTGARGVLTVSQVSPGRKNRLYYEIDGAKSSIVWDGERPNELWIGHRDRPNEHLLKDPALLAPEARQFASYPGGHSEGFPDTFKQMYTAIYRYIQAGDFTALPDFPTFADGHRALRVGEAVLRSAREGRWVNVSEISE